MITKQPFLKPKNQRLLVIGGSGRLGPLLRQAWSPAFAAPAEPAPETVLWQARRESAFAGQGGPSLVFDPLADPEAFAAAARGCDVIVNLAGVTAGTPEALALNTALARAALDAADAAGGRPVLLASSAAVYGAGHAGLCRETDAPTPLAPYGAAKAAMEAELAGRAGAIWLRIGNVAGADALLGRAAPEGGRVLDILPDGHGPRRSFIGPQALAAALARLVRLVAAGAEVPAVLNLSLAGALPMDALLTAAGESWVPRPAPANLIPHVELDVTRAVDLGLVPEAPARAAAVVADLRALQETRA